MKRTASRWQAQALTHKRWWDWPSYIGMWVHFGSFSSAPITMVTPIAALHGDGNDHILRVWPVDAIASRCVPDITKPATQGWLLEIFLRMWEAEGVSRALSLADLAKREPDEYETTGDLLVWAILEGV